MTATAQYARSHRQSGRRELDATVSVGYLLAGYELPAEQPDGPRSEFAVLRAHHGWVTLDPGHVRASGSAAARRLLASGRPRLAMAVHAARLTSMRALVCSGEDVGLPAAVATWRRREPAVMITTHGSYFGSSRFEQLMRVLRHAPHVHYLCLSASLAEALVRRFRVPTERVHNTGYGSDTEFFTPGPRPSGRPCLVSAGAANRDYATLSAAARGLDVRLRIAPGSAWFAMTPNLGSVLDGAEVRLMAYPELREAYAGATAVVVPLHPARHACGYAVIADAMAMGRPVIATRTEAPSDFLVDGETGLYVPPGDPAALRRAIQRLLHCPEQAAAMGAAGRQRMERLFSVERYCSLLDETVRRVIGT